jgi:hypothetical protein
MSYSAVSLRAEMMAGRLVRNRLLQKATSWREKAPGGLLPEKKALKLVRIDSRSCWDRQERYGSLAGRAEVTADPDQVFHFPDNGVAGIEAVPLQAHRRLADRAFLDYRKTHVLHIGGIDRRFTQTAYTKTFCSSPLWTFVYG